MKKKTYRYVALDKYGERRCWAWGSTLLIAEKRIHQAIREFIRIEGKIYGEVKEWHIKWELRKEDDCEFSPDRREYLDKPSKKPPRTRRRKNPDEPAV